ncbi:MAG TPA: hypothetical protein VGL71_02515 [Urbifossiella sp.]|jgi:hypothetical protein
MTRLRFACMAAACAAVMLAGSPRASAESVSLQFDKQVNGDISLSGNPSGPFVQDGPFYWHDNGTPMNGNFPPPTATFCLQPGGPLPGPGGTATFGVETLAGDLGTSKATLITELYANNYNAAWSSSSFTGSTASQAFQIALWKLSVDGTTTISSTTGGFTADTSLAVVQQAQAMLNSLSSTNVASFTSQYNIVALVAPDPNDPKSQDFQDQITLQTKTSAVPAPPGVVLAGIGFLGLIGRSRWLRRKQTAV